MSQLLDMFSDEVTELNVLKTEAEQIKTAALQMQRERITAEVNKTLTEERDHSPELLHLQSRQQQQQQQQQQQKQQRELRESQTKHHTSSKLLEENKSRPTSRQSRREDSISDRDSCISTPSITTQNNTTTSSISTTTTNTNTNSSVNTKATQNKRRPRSSGKRVNSANSRAGKLWATLRQTREDMILDKLQNAEVEYDAQSWLGELKKSEARQMQSKEHLANLERFTLRQLVLFSSPDNNVYSMRDMLQMNKYEANTLPSSHSSKEKQMQESEAPVQSITSINMDDSDCKNSVEDYSNLIINPIEFANNYNRKLYEAFGYKPLLDDDERKNGTCNTGNNYKNSSIARLQPTHLQKELQNYHHSCEEEQQKEEEEMCSANNMKDKLSEWSHKLMTHRAGGETLPLTPSWLASPSTSHWWPALTSYRHENNKPSYTYNGNETTQINKEEIEEVNAAKEKMYNSNLLPSIINATVTPFIAAHMTSADNVTHLEINSGNNSSNGVNTYKSKYYSCDEETSIHADSHALLPHIKSHIAPTSSSSLKFAASSPARVNKSQLVKQENKNIQKNVQADKLRKMQNTMTKTKQSKMIASSSLTMLENQASHYGIQCSEPSWQVQLRTCVDNETSFAIRFTNCNAHQLRMKLHSSTHPWVEYECSRFAPVAGNEKKIRVRCSNNKFLIDNGKAVDKGNTNILHTSPPLSSFSSPASPASPSSSLYSSALSTLASETAFSTVCCGGYVEVTITFEPHNLLEPSFDTELKIGVTREVNKLQNNEEGSVWHFITVKVHCETIMPNFTLAPCTEQEIEEFMNEEAIEEYSDEYDNEICRHNNENANEGRNYRECATPCNCALPEPDISNEYEPDHILYSQLEHEQHFDQISYNDDNTHTYNNNQNDMKSIDCLFPFTFVTASRTKYFTLQNIGSNALVNVMCTSSSFSSSTTITPTSSEVSEVSEFVSFPSPLHETLLPQGDVMRVKITFTPLTPGPVKGTLHVIVREESHGKVLCEYCFNLFGVGIVPDVKITEFSCVLQNEVNISEKNDHGVIKDYHDCNETQEEELQKEENDLHDVELANGAKKLTNNNVVRVNNNKQWVLFANSKEEEEQVLSQQKEQCTSASSTIEAQELTCSSSTSKSKIIKYYLSQTTPHVVSTLIVHVQNATFVPLPCTWEIDGAKVIAEHLHKDYISSDNINNSDSALLSLESVKQEKVHALVHITTSSSSSTTCAIDSSDTWNERQTSSQIFELPSSSISTFYFNIIPLTASPFMLACNLYLLQLPHSDSLPMHYACHVAPHILAMLKLANRRKYVLPTDLSMNSTTAIQELYHANDNCNNDHLPCKPSLAEQYCTALQLPDYELRKEELQCKSDNCNNETTREIWQKGLSMTGFLLFAEPQLPHMTFTPTRISWKEQDADTLNYVNGELNKCLLHCPYVEPITLRNHSRLPLHFTFVPHKGVEEVEHVEESEREHERLVNNFSLEEVKACHDQQHAKQISEQCEQLEVWFEPDSSVIAPLDTVTVYAHFIVHSQGEWSKRYDCCVSEVMEWIAPHLSCPHQIEINVVGIAAGIRVNKDKMFFGTVEEGETRSQELTIYNDNLMPVTIDVLTHRENVKEENTKLSNISIEQNNISDGDSGDIEKCARDEEAIRILPSAIFTIRAKGTKTICIAQRGCMPLWSGGSSNYNDNYIQRKDKLELLKEEAGWCYESLSSLFVQVRDGLTTMVETHMTVQRPVLFVEETTVQLGIVPRAIWQEVEFYVANPSVFNIPFTVCHVQAKSSKPQSEQKDNYDDNGSFYSDTVNNENVEVEIVTPECVIPAQTSHFAIKVNVRFTSFSASYNNSNNLDEENKDNSNNVDDECNVCHLSLYNHRYRDQVMQLRICCDVIEQLSVSLHLTGDKLNNANTHKKELQEQQHVIMSEQTINLEKTEQMRECTKKEEKTSAANIESVSINQFVKVLLHNLVERIIQSSRSKLDTSYDYEKNNSILDKNANTCVHSEQALLMLPYCEEPIANIILPDDLTVPFASHAQTLIITNWSGCTTHVNVQLTNYSTQCQSEYKEETNKMNSTNKQTKVYRLEKVNKLHNEKYSKEQHKMEQLANNLVNSKYVNSSNAPHKIKKKTQKDMCENIAPTFWTRMINGEEQRRRALHKTVNKIVNAFMLDGRGTLSVLERVRVMEEERDNNNDDNDDDEEEVLQGSNVNYWTAVSTPDLQPHGELQMRILFHCHLPGSYMEELICHCAYLPNVHLPLRYHVFGKPIILHPSTLGLQRTPSTSIIKHEQDVNEKKEELVNDYCRSDDDDVYSMKEANDTLTLTLPAAIAEVSSAHRTVQLVNRLPRDVKASLHIYPTPFSFEVAAVDGNVPAHEVTLSLISLSTATREAECNKFGRVSVTPSEMIIPAMHSAEVELSFCPHLQLFTATNSQYNSERTPCNGNPSLSKNNNTNDDKMHCKEVCEHNKYKENESEVMKHINANQMWSGSLVVTSELAHTSFNDAFLIDEFYSTHHDKYLTKREMSLAKVKPTNASSATTTAVAVKSSADNKNSNIRIIPLTSGGGSIGGGNTTDALKPMQPFRTRINGRVLRRNQIILPTVQEKSILREWTLKQHNEVEKQNTYLQHCHNSSNNDNAIDKEFITNEEEIEENANYDSKILLSTHLTNFESITNSSHELEIQNLINEEQERVELMTYINSRRSELACDSAAHFVPLEVALRALCGLPHLTVESVYHSSDLCTHAHTITSDETKEKQENYEIDSVDDVVEFEPILPGTASLYTFRLINRNMATLLFTLHLVEELHYHIHSTRVIHTSSNFEEESHVPLQEECIKNTFRKVHCNQADDVNINNIKSVVHHLECNEILQITVQVGEEKSNDIDDDNEDEVCNGKYSDQVRCKLQNEIIDMLMVSFVNCSSGSNNTDNSIAGSSHELPTYKEFILKESLACLTQKIKLHCRINPLRVWMTPHELIFKNRMNANRTNYNLKQSSRTHPNAIIPALPATHSSDISYPQYITLYNASREPVSFELVPLLDNELMEETPECPSTMTTSQKLHHMQHTSRAGYMDQHDTCTQINSDNDEDKSLNVISSRDALQHFILFNDGKGVIPSASAGGAPGKVQLAIYFKPYALLAYKVRYLLYVNNKPYKSCNEISSFTNDGNCINKGCNVKVKETNANETKDKKGGKEVIVLRLYGKSYDT